MTGRAQAIASPTALGKISWSDGCTTRFAALYAPRHRLTNVGEGLVAVEAAQLDDLTIQFEAMIRKLGLPKTEAARIFV